MTTFSFTKLWRSLAFRLIMIYMTVFGASVALLLTFIGLATLQTLENQVKHTVNIQLADLGRKFVTDGPAETRDTINHLIAKDVENTSIYLLISPTGDILTGNLKRWPDEASQPREWVHFTLTRALMDLRTPAEALAITTTLPGGYQLLVGYNLDSSEKLAQVFHQLLLISLAMTVALAAIGGGLLTRMISRRLEIVNAACRRVMAGDMQHRAVVRGSGDEFDHLAENFNEMLTKIDELIGGIRDISANVAHDLRTPLNRLRHRLENITLLGLPPAQTKDEIRLAVDEVDRLVATFNAILRISQAEVGAGFDRFEALAFSAMVEDVVELYDALAEERGITQELHITPDLIYHGDKHLLSQAFANLLDNAIKYSPPDTTVTVTLAQDTEGLLLIVADHGPGIPAEYYTRVTQKFFRLEASRTTSGNGLGLSLTLAVIKLHGGALQFDDNQPGLRVTVRLPL